MQRVSYGGESFITSDEFGEALLKFTAAAAMNGVGEVVKLPTVAADGNLVVVALVVGPSSELLVSPIESAFAEPVDLGLAHELRERTAALAASSSHAHGAAIAGVDLEREDPDFR